MGKISTEAWVLHAGEKLHAAAPSSDAELVRQTYQFDDICEQEVLVRPLFGCMEGNMLHAVRRDPIDICLERGEDEVVIGNAGVVRVEKVGVSVRDVAVGDACIVFGNGVWDEHGYPMQIVGYDAPGTIGVLAKTTKLHEKQLIKVPKESAYSLEQWAAFSLRYISAWANWRVAYACWKSQNSNVMPAETVVCGWGGGVSFAELSLARHLGCQSLMVASTPERLELLREEGIDAIDRSEFSKDNFERGILAQINRMTNGRGVSIFIDNVGGPVHRTTLKALAREGVLTTCGWKRGMRTTVPRAMECISRHIHVHTHYAKYDEGIAAVEFAEQNGWMPPPAQRIWSWDEIPSMFEQYSQGAIDSYFPIFSINT